LLTAAWHTAAWSWVKSLSPLASYLQKGRGAAGRQTPEEALAVARELAARGYGTITEGHG